VFVEEKGRVGFTEKKAVSGIMLTLLVISLVMSVFHFQPGKADPGTRTVDNDGSAGFSRVRDTAVGAAFRDAFRPAMNEAPMTTIGSFSDDGLYGQSTSNAQLAFGVGSEHGFNSRVNSCGSVCAGGDSAELVVGLNDVRTNSCSELVNLIRGFGGKLINTVSMDGRVAAVVADVSSVAVSAFVSEVKVAGLSRYVEPNMRFEADFVPNDPYWPMQWAPSKIEADYAWNTTTGNASVLVAVIDTGVDWHHPDLAANYVPLGYDWVNNDADPMDDCGHGTHCAGIIAAVLNNSIGVTGLAQVRIMAEKALDQYGYGSEDDLAKAIVHAVDQGANILSCSWGAYGESALLHEAVKYAYDHGVLVVAAAGNDKTESKHYPAAYEEVVAVTATDESDSPAWFTDYGGWVEVAAPGVDIYSTMPTYHVTLNFYGCSQDYGYLSGTSMACPQVAGVAALIWSLFPYLTRDQVRVQLRRTADDLGAPGFDEYYGYGRINARKAVEQTLPEHDMVLLGLKAPPVLKPFDTATINGTLLNFGADDESSITVQLLVNGSVVDYESVDHLASGASTTVSCAWSPTAEGRYNVTFYVTPVDGETVTEDNFLSEYVPVRLSGIVMVPDDFPTIQKAIDEVNPGCTIQVAPGTYSESLFIDKSVAVVGEDCSTTVIDGNGIDSVITVSTEQGDVNVSGFTVQNSGHGLYQGGIMLYSSNNNISGNVIRNCDCGIGLFGSNNNTVVDNTVSNSNTGIHLEGSSGNLLRNNHMLGNTYNLDVYRQSGGVMLSDYLNDVDCSNTVDNKPVYYWVNQHDKTAPADAGYVAAINSTRITVRNLSLTNNGQGVLFAYTTNSTIANMLVSNNGVGIDLDESDRNVVNGNVAAHDILGIWLYSHSNANIIISNNESEGMAGIVLSENSSSNIIRDNNVSENTFLLGTGIVFEDSSDSNIIVRNGIRNNTVGISMSGLPCNDNILYHNNFINNTDHVLLYDSHVNVWDNGYPSGGNYWSGYMGTDHSRGPDQNVRGSDGISDMPYVVDANNLDHYPLMYPWPRLTGDVNGDDKVLIDDVLLVANAYGSRVGDPLWNPFADINEDGRIRVDDVLAVALNFGKTRT
jgi:thermitase